MTDGRRGARAALVAVALAAGCEPAVHAIVVKVPAPPVTADDAAVTLVIAQPESRLHAVGILDGNGQLVAQLDDRCHAILHLKEGPNVLYAVLGNEVDSTDRIEGTLLPGRVYYATVGAREGGVAFRILTPRSAGGSWGRRDEILRATPRVEMDPALVGRAVNELGSADAFVQAGEARAAKMDAAARAEHEFQENDGS